MKDEELNEGANGTGEEMKPENASVPELSAATEILYR